MACPSGAFTPTWRCFDRDPNDKACEADARRTFTSIAVLETPGGNIAALKIDVKHERSAIALLERRTRAKESERFSQCAVNYTKKTCMLIRQQRALIRARNGAKSNDFFLLAKMTIKIKYRDKYQIKS